MGRHPSRRADLAPGPCLVGGGLLGGKDPSGRLLTKDFQTVLQTALFPAGRLVVVKKRTDAQVV